MPLLPAANRTKRIVTLSLPIIGGMASQNILNLVDTAMVGTLGDVALAATGMGSFAIFMAFSIIMGLSAGVQAIAARRLGEGRHGQTAVALNTGIILALIWAVPWTMLGHALAPKMFGFLLDDPAVLAEAVPYFRTRLLATLAVGLNFSFRGYWNGVNKPKLYMGTLVLSHICNLFLNWVLIYGNLGAPAMGTLGAATASAIATYVAAATYMIAGFYLARGNGFLKVLPSKLDFKHLIKLAIPASMAQFFMATGYTALMWIVAQTGTSALAAANVLLTVTLVPILVGLGFGFVAASMVGQALGRGDVRDAEAWGWDTVKIAVIVVGSMGLPMVLIPQTLLSCFLHDPLTREIAVDALRLVGATMGIDAVGLVLLNAMYGAGHSRPVFVVGTTLQWGMGLPLAYLAGPVMGLDLVWIWGAILLYRGGQSAIYAHMWRGRGWSEVEL
jgi:putative MATE family efflux protein